jgi:Zn-dependent protease
VLVRPTIPQGRWFGVPVGLHYSWFVIAWLMTVSVAGEFAGRNSRWDAPTVWALAVTTTVLFFLCIVLHELAHASVARLSDVPVSGITLFALGGLAQIEKEASTPAKEFWIAIAGPGMSFAIGFGCLILARAIHPGSPAATPSALAALLGWLAYINVNLALFNLIPGFPLDGGRVLRSIVWAVTRNADRATIVAARVGQAVASVFMGLGLFSVLTRGNFSGLWIAIIGWFLLEGAQSYYLQATLRQRSSA